MDNCQSESRGRKIRGATLVAGGGTVMHAENSEVLFKESVAVAVMEDPGETLGSDSLIDASPLTFV